MRLIAIILTLCLLTACTSTRAPQSPPPGTPSFTAATYNIAHGRGDKASTLAVINALPADMICLQEINDDWATILKRGRAKHFAHFAVNEGGDRYGDGMAMLSRFPVETIRVIPSQTGWFNAWLVQCKTPAGPVQFLNVHLRPPVNDKGGFSLWALLTTPDDRVREIKQFTSHLDLDLPTIVLGDYNEPDNGDALAWLRERGYRDALAEFDRRTPTWRWKTFPVIHRRLDHIAYSTELYCYQAWVSQVGGSDHLPVLATFGSAKTRAQPLSGKPGMESITQR